MTSSHASRSEWWRWYTTGPGARMTLCIEALTTTAAMCRWVRRQWWTGLLSVIATNGWTTNRSDVIRCVRPTNEDTGRCQT